MGKTFKDEKVPEVWRQSILQECKDYIGIKLTSHTLKLFEMIMDRILREEVQIGRRQLGIMEGARSFSPWSFPTGIFPPGVFSLVFSTPGLFHPGFSHPGLFSPRSFPH